MHSSFLLLAPGSPAIVCRIVFVHKLKAFVLDNKT